MEKKRFKLGVAPTRRTSPRFKVDVASKDRERIEAKLREWGVDFVGLDWLNEDAFLYDPLDAPRVAARFRAEGVDALFVPHCNFGTEAAVGILARELGKPVLLWGPRDSAPPAVGERTQDIQCGLFATSKVLRRMNVPFTYVVNSGVDSEVFKRGFNLFVGAASAVDSFLGARIGQISVRPPSFWTTMYNEGELLERWGIQVVPLTLEEVRQAVARNVKDNSKRLQDAMEELRATVDLSTVADEKVAQLAGFKLALVDFYHSQGLSAMALHCHKPLRDALGIAACLVNGVLADMGISVACETDVHGALTSLLVQGAVLNTRPSMFADLTIRHPQNDNSELLWHCGCFPTSLATNPGVQKLRIHQGFPAAASFEAKKGDITVARFDGDQGHYSLFLGQAKGVQGPATNGAYVWVEVKNWPEWEERLMYGPYIHHCAAVHGYVVPVLYEACKYIPGLEPDVVEPTEQQIRSYWRGEDLR